MTNARTALLVTGALVIGGGGTATASHLITGKQIRDGSITLRDLSASTKRTLRPQIRASASGAITQTTAEDGTPIIVVSAEKGDKGEKGDTGSPGQQGQAGATGAFRVGHLEASGQIEGNSTLALQVKCPNGPLMVGGYNASATGEDGGISVSFVSATTDTYRVGFVNTSAWAKPVSITANCME